MLRGFRMGGDWWSVRLVPPSSPSLIDRTGRRTVATTEPVERRINVSNALCGAFLEKVVVHEATHAAMVSYGILSRLRAIVPRNRWVEVEETICNILADHGAEALEAAGGVRESVEEVRRLAWSFRGGAR